MICARSFFLLTLGNMEANVKELTAKLRALDFAAKRSDEVMKTNSSEAISRHEQSIVTKINACHILKDSIEEQKILQEESEEQVL